MKPQFHTQLVRFCDALLDEESLIFRLRHSTDPDDGDDDDGDGNDGECDDGAKDFFEI